MKDTFRICRKCGEPIAVIEYGIYRKKLVDAEAIAVIADRNGREYVRIDGSKVQAREAEPEENGAEYAYRPHRCGNWT